MAGIQIPNWNAMREQMAAPHPLQASLSALGGGVAGGVPGIGSDLLSYLQGLQTQDEAAIKKDAMEVLAPTTLARRGFTTADPLGAKVTMELMEPALNASRQRMQALGPQLWAMQMQQRQMQMDAEDRRNQMAWEKEQMGWQRDLHRDEMRDRDAARRDAAAARTYAGGRVRLADAPTSIPGAGLPGTGSVSGSPAVGSGWDTRLGSERGGVFRDKSGNLPGGIPTNGPPGYNTPNGSGMTPPANTSPPGYNTPSSPSPAGGTYGAVAGALGQAQTATQANSLGQSAASYPWRR